MGPNFNEKKLLNNFPCLIPGQDTNPSTSDKNLGVLFDSSLNFRKHISQTCRACFYHIRDLRRIRTSLSLDLAKQIALAEKDIARLQRVQNCLASRLSRSVPILKQLHWLPVKCRIHFKICAIKTTNLHIWLIYLFGRNSQNIHAPQIQRDLLFLV